MRLGRLFLLSLILVTLAIVVVGPSSALAVVDMPQSEPTRTRAVANPDSITIPTVRVFQNIFDTGDQVVIVETKVMYTVDPTEEPSDTFTVTFTAGAASYSMPLLYYDHALCAFYLTPAQAVVWGAAATVVVAGNPLYFTTLTEGVNQRTYALSAGYWITGSLTESPGYLQSWCLTLATLLETSWGLTLLIDDKLNAVGAEFFLEVLPGLDSACPDFFAVSTEYLEPDSKTHSKTYETELLARIGARLHDAIDGLATVAHIPYTLMSLLLTGVMFFIVGGAVFAATGSPGMVIPVSVPFLFAAAVIGLIPLSVVFFIVAIVVVIFAIVFIVARVG